MIRSIVALLMLLATHPAIAGCPQGFVQQQRVVYAQPQQLVTQSVYGAQIVSYAPVYGQVQLQQVQPYQYWSANAQSQEEAISKRVEQLVMARIDAAVKEQLQKQQNNVYIHPGVKLVSTKCVSCHVAGNASVAAGKSPELFDAAGAWKGTLEQAQAAAKAVAEGRMPKPPKPSLDTSEFIVFKDYLSTQLDAQGVK